MSAEEFTVNGVRIGERGEGPRQTLELPSGKVAIIRRAHGRDLMRAQRAATGGDPTAVVFALIAELCEVDGRHLVFEDVMEMDLGDVLALQTEVVGENFELPLPRASRD
jgi:hypothetical protein